MKSAVAAQHRDVSSRRHRSSERCASKKLDRSQNGDSETLIERTVKALEANGMAAMGSIRRNSLYTLRIGGELPLQRLGN